MAFSLINIGLSQALSSKETKRVVLLNKLTLIGVICNFIFSIPILINWGMIPIFYMHVFSIVSLLFINALQRFKFYQFARVAFWISLYITVYAFSKHLKVGTHNEYYFSILAVIPLLFFDKRIITISALILSIFGFYSFEISDLLFGTELAFGKHYNSGFTLFTVLYLIVDYFKRLNERNEKALIAEKIKAESATQTIEKQKQELEEVNRFQSHFFVNISHELRTPLTLIEGYNDKLLSLPATQYNHEIEEIASTINVQSNKIKKIVDDVIDLAKMEVKEFRPSLKQVELSGFMKQMYHSYHSVFQNKKIELSLTIDIPQTIVSADSLYLERALNNMIINALKYTPPHGKVSIQVAKREEDQVTILIADTGVGISPQAINKIFDRFYQANNDINRSGGSGVGLAFAKEVIRLHQGNIEVNSKLGDGSQFTVTLPVISFGKEQAIENEISIPDSSFLNKESPITNNQLSDTCILIVDDHEDMRKYISSLLTDFKCLVAEDGYAALALLEKHTVDYIITDFMMPKMDGYELISAIKNLGIQIPILMLSARSDIEGKLKVLRLGIDDYLTKPFNKDELRIRISNALRNYSVMINKNQIEKEDPLSIDSVENLKDQKWLESVSEFSSKNIQNNDFGLPSLIAEFAMSQSTLYRKIKSLTGLSPNEFIREIKLQQARKLIDEKKYSTVKQLAYAVGFQKTSHFSSLYEKRFGIRPNVES